MPKVFIQHISDVHQASRGMARQSTVMDAGAHAFRVPGRDDFFAFVEDCEPRLELRTSGGDDHTGNAFDARSDHQGTLAVLNHLGIGFHAFGNHETDVSPERLAAHDRVLAPRLAANLFWRDSDERPYQPWAVQRAAGLSIGIIGVTTPHLDHHAGPRAAPYRLGDPIEAVCRAKAQIEAAYPDAADWVFLVVSHCGLHYDRRIAREVPGLTAVLGGHSHVSWCKQEGATWVLHPDAMGRGVGQLLVRSELGALTSKARVVSTAEVTPDPRVQALFRDAWLEIPSELKAELTTCTARLQGRDGVYTGCSRLGGLVADAMLAVSGADCAVMNDGGVRSDLPEGSVTRLHVENVLQLDNHVVVAQYTTHELLALLTVGLFPAVPEDETEDAIPARRVHVAGLTVYWDDAGVQSIALQDKEIVHDGVAVLPGPWRVALPSFCHKGGDGWPVPADGRAREMQMTYATALAKHVKDRPIDADALDGPARVVRSS